MLLQVPWRGPSLAGLKLTAQGTSPVLAVIGVPGLPEVRT